MLSGLECVLEGMTRLDFGLLGIGYVLHGHENLSRPSLLVAREREHGYLEPAVVVLGAAFLLKERHVAWKLPCDFLGVEHCKGLARVPSLDGVAEEFAELLKAAFGRKAGAHAAALQVLVSAANQVDGQQAAEQVGGRVDDARSRLALEQECLVPLARLHHEHHDHQQGGQQHAGYQDQPSPVGVADHSVGDVRRERTHQHPVGGRQLHYVGVPHAFGGSVGEADRNPVGYVLVDLFDREVAAEVFAVEHFVDVLRVGPFRCSLGDDFPVGLAKISGGGLTREVGGHDLGKRAFLIDAYDHSDDLAFEFHRSEEGDDVLAVEHGVVDEAGAAFALHALDVVIAVVCRVYAAVKVVRHSVGGHEERVVELGEVERGDGFERIDVRAGKRILVHACDHLHAAKGVVEQVVDAPGRLAGRRFQVFAVLCDDPFGVRIHEHQQRDHDGDHRYHDS